MPQGYLPCQFVSPVSGVQCNSWYPSEEDKHFCIVHRGTISASLAGHEIEKETFINRSRESAQPLIDAIKNLSPVESLEYLDVHIAGIERIIEEKKLEAMSARAIRQGQFEKLSENERKRLRAIPNPVREKRESANEAKKLGQAMLAKEKAIKSLMNTGMTREKALAMLEG